MIAVDEYFHVFVELECL